MVFTMFWDSLAHSFSHQLTHSLTDEQTRFNGGRGIKMSRRVFTGL